MFLSQVDAKSISDEEKFGYLLESIGLKVRDRIANLKPGTVGYKTAWDHQLKKEYGQTKVIVDAHMDEIINLLPVKGSNYFRVQEFFHFSLNSTRYTKICCLNDFSVRCAEIYNFMLIDQQALACRFYKIYDFSLTSQFFNKPLQNLRFFAFLCNANSTY